MTTSYYTINGKIRGEATNGVYRPYGPDALGSVAATYDSTGALENTYRNAPYGTQVAKTGTAPDPAFLWAGTPGYRALIRDLLRAYVRTRNYGSEVGQWTSLDALWPSEHAYRYAGSNPASFDDPFGLSVLKAPKAGPGCVPTLPPYFSVTTGCDTLNIPVPIAGYQGSINIQVCYQQYDDSGCRGSRYATSGVQTSVAVSLTWGAPKWRDIVNDVDKMQQLALKIVDVLIGSEATSTTGLAKPQLCVCQGDELDFVFGGGACAVIGSITCSIGVGFPGPKFVGGCNLNIGYCGLPSMKVFASGSYKHFS